MTRRIARYGVLALALGALAATPREAGAFETKRSAAGSPVKWSAERIAFSVRPEVADVPGAEKAIANAMAAWSGRGGAPEIVLGRNASAGETPGGDGHNTIFYAKDGYEPLGTALAITVLSFDDRSGRILDADIVLNGKFKLGRIKSDGDADAYDINRVVAHEMGHALGLSDEPGQDDALMFPYVAPASVLLAAPASDDIAGLSSLYDSASDREDQTIGCGASVAGRARSPLPIGLAVAASFGLAAVMLARGGRRARRAAMGSAAFAAVALVMPPRITTSKATQHVHDDAGAAEDAVATVTAARTTNVDGLFHTDLDLATSSCRAAPCAPVLHARVWGGTLAGVRQEIGGAAAPRAGDRVALGYASSPGHAVFRTAPLAMPPRVVVRTVARLGR